MIWLDLFTRARRTNTLDLSCIYTIYLLYLLFSIFIYFTIFHRECFDFDNSGIEKNVIELSETQISGMYVGWIFDETHVVGREKSRDVRK